MSVWLLPENVADMLPREARAVERLRQEFLSLVTSHGFELIRPPLMEYVDSLQVGIGSSLDLRTFKVVDQISGRLIGLRADMTPQVARIDAHILNRNGIVRLCYAGTVLHARPLHPMASREPYVAGVEVFGSKSRESDLEVITLGIESLRRFRIEKINLDLGHVGVVRAVLKDVSLPEEISEKLLNALSHKDVTAIRELSGILPQKTVDLLVFISQTFGDRSVLPQLREKLAEYPEAVKALDEVEWLSERCGADSVSFDFADVHGFGYLTGVTFGVTVPRRFQAVLRGGRYDDVGAKFGRMRPAVGFTLYLREIANLLETHRPNALIAPYNPGDEALKNKIEQLRNDGEVVIVMLPEDTVESLQEGFRLEEELIFVNGQWTKVKRPEVL